MLSQELLEVALVALKVRGGAYEGRRFDEGAEDRTDELPEAVAVFEAAGPMLTCQDEARDLVRF